MKNFKNLEVGKTYRAKNGCTGVVESLDSDFFPFIIRWDDGNEYSYKIDGNVYSDNRNHPYNVAECLYVETPETPESIQAEIERLQKKLDELKKNEPLEVDSSWFGKNIQVRDGGEFRDKGFYLCSIKNWEIVTDLNNYQVLIAKTKQDEN